VLTNFSIYNSTIIYRKEINERIVEMLFVNFLYTIQQLYIEKKSTKGIVNSACKVYIQSTII